MAEWFLSLWENVAFLPVGFVKRRKNRLRLREFSYFEILKKMFVRYSTYILKSEKNGTHYYGHSQNLEKRLNDHNNGRVRSTKAHRPWKIIYVEEFSLRSEAREREFFFKSLEGYNYLKQRKII
jgi:putative endonuclease